MGRNHCFAHMQEALCQSLGADGVRPHRERLAEHCLGLLGFAVYSPRLRVYRIRHGRRVETIVPLFPGYLFVEIVLGVRGVLKSGSTPAVVPDTVIDEIRQRERNGVVELQHRRLRAGAQVRILGGPFRDRLGLCAGMDGRERVRILLKMLGSQRQCC
jgi:transcriptional antiterminator RfaH